MPAAAVIPAPLAYIKVVAVEKLVVEFMAISHEWHPLRVIFGSTWLSYFTRKSLFRHLIECEARWVLCLRAKVPPTLP